MMGRRELLVALGGAASVGALSLAGCGTRPRGRRIDARFDEVPPAIGHRLRGDIGPLVRAAEGEPASRADVIIVGGGVAGLAAARALRAGGVEDLRVLELDDSLGGTSAWGRSAVTAFPWGAHYLPVPRASDSELCALLAEMGVVSRIDADGTVHVDEPFLVRSPEERIFENGYFHEGERPLDGASAAARAEHRRFDALVGRYVAMRDAEGRRAFDLPVERSGRDPEVLALDAITARGFLDAHGFTDARLRAYLDYGTRDDFGCTLETTSAWALLHYHAARRASPAAEPAPQITFPEGNGAFVRHLARGLDARIAKATLVLDVRTTEDGVEVLAIDLGAERPMRLRAARAIVATPKHVAARIVADVRSTPEAFSAFTYAPWLVANLHLRRRPTSRGLPFAWDTILADSRSLGYVCATHQRGRDTGPTVLTYYMAFAHEAPAHARRTLLEADANALARLVLDDLRVAHREIDNCVEHVALRRHGHAMVRPVPGLHTSPARLAARTVRGRVHFGHTDDSGMALFEEAFAQGSRAGREVVAALRAG